MGMNRYRGPSRKVGKDRRWPGLRLQALRRDDWQCVQCGTRVGLEVDHIQPVRDCPERAFDLTNLQALCKRCHSAKTRKEMGLPELSPERKDWRDLLRLGLDL